MNNNLNILYYNDNCVVKNNKINYYYEKTNSNILLYESNINYIQFEINVFFIKKNIKFDKYNLSFYINKFINKKINFYINYYNEIVYQKSFIWQLPIAILLNEDNIYDLLQTNFDKFKFYKQDYINKLVLNPCIELNNKYTWNKFIYHFNNYNYLKINNLNLYFSNIDNGNIYSKYLVKKNNILKNIFEDLNNIFLYNTSKNITINQNNNYLFF